MAEAVPAPDARRAIAFVVGVCATLLFFALRVFVALGGHEPLALDVWWHDLMVATSNPAMIIVAWIPAVAGGTIGMIVVGLVLILIFLWRRERANALTLAIAMVVVVGIGAPMAALIARTRPADSLAESVPTSFPSGHTAVATTVVIVLALLLRQRWMWFAGGAWVVVMMWSRTYLHAHWLSDVLAGLLEGIAVGTLVWALAEVVRDRRAVRAVVADPPEVPQEGAVN